MGYRLEVYKCEYTDCGGKLYGYLDDEELYTLKSWQWLHERNYVDKDEYWSYGASHECMLYKREYEEFIKLYIEDYNKHSLYGNTLSIDDFKDSLNADCVVICWE